MTVIAGAYQGLYKYVSEERQERVCEVVQNSTNSSMQQVYLAALMKGQKLILSFHQ